jgi:excisionase family DNA binding protein
VADLLRLTKKGIYAMVEARRIPFVKISNRVRFLKSDVLDWLSENRVPTLERRP